MVDRLGDRYLRIDARWARDAGLGIEVASHVTSETFVALARQTIRSLDWERLLGTIGSIFVSPTILSSRRDRGGLTPVKD